jgi:hypothetical protein
MFADEQDTELPIRGEVRAVGYRRVSHGLYLRLTPGLSADKEFMRDLTAWLKVLPEGAVFTHVTAARLLGWQLPSLPEQVPVFAAVEADDNRPRRSGLICSRLVRPTRPVVAHTLPVEEPEEILLRAARDMGMIDLVIMIDSARRQEVVNEKRLLALLATRRPGVRPLRMAWSLSDPRADSGPESVLRLFHDCIDVPVEPQAKLYDESGNLVGQADLLVTGTAFLHEYDGAGHRAKGQQRTDLRRGRGLSGTKYVRNGFTLDDLLNHPLVTMHEIDRLLERPHKMARIWRWRRMVENSLYSPVGRERVLNRWRRVNGIVEWSRTA